MLFRSAALLVTAGCSHTAPQSGQAAAASPRDPLSVTAGPELLAQLQVGPIASVDVAGTRTVAGRVEADDTRLARVTAPVTGRVIALQVVEGQVVRRGDVLALVHSKELADAQSAFLKAQLQQQLAQRAAERATLLLDAGVIGEVEQYRRYSELSQT